MNRRLGDSQRISRAKVWVGSLLFLLVVATPKGYCHSLQQAQLSQHIRRDTLMVFPCDRDGGVRLVDASGIGLHGILIGATYAWDEDRGRVLRFAGPRDHVVIPGVKLGAFTFSAWVKTATLEVDNRLLMQLTLDEPVLSIQGCAQGSLSLVSASGAALTDADWPLPRGHWCHVCVTYDGERVAFYRNGKITLVDELSIPLPACGLMTIGGERSRLKHSWQGCVDDIVITNRSLKRAEVEELYRLGSSLPLQPARASADEIVIEAFIDDTSELHILPDLIYWENKSNYAKPGRHGNRSEPTWINGRPWKPHWNRHDEIGGMDMSSQYGLTIEPAGFAVELVAVGSSRRAEQIERGGIQACRDGSGLIVRFEDLGYGPRWYRIRLYPWRYVDPVQACNTPSLSPCIPVAPVGAALPALVATFADPPGRKPAVAPDVVVQATQMSPVPPVLPVPPAPVLPPNTMVVEAYIDDVSDLWIKGDGLIWKNVTAAAKPGRGDSHNEPTYINGQPWYPAWIESNDDRGIDLSDLRPHTLAPGFYSARLYAVGRDRQNWERQQEGAGIETIQLPESLVVRINDPAREPNWYRIIVTRQNN